MRKIVQSMALLVILYSQNVANFFKNFFGDEIFFELNFGKSSSSMGLMFLLKHFDRSKIDKKHPKPKYSVFFESRNNKGNASWHSCYIGLKFRRLKS